MTPQGDCTKQARARAMPGALRRGAWGLCIALASTVGSVGALYAQDCVTADIDQAVKVEYELDGAAVGVPSALLFKGSHDGTVRAEDVATGSELWRFRAPEVESTVSAAESTVTAAESTVTAAESAVTAGERLTHLTVLRFDANGDGIIDPHNGDRVWLYFGLKRAGAVYYALDVTDKSPRVLWRADSSTMPGLGDAWSTPTIARIRVGGARQNGEHFVVIVGGGYSAAGAAASTAGRGNRLFILDAASGRVLWRASDSAPAEFVSARMTEPFASRIVAIDFDGDQFADRLYAADVGARVWRFDIWNGRSAEQLVTGGVFASLGSRRFFNAPDVAYIKPRGGAAYYNLAIGSGDADAARLGTAAEPGDAGELGVVTGTSGAGSGAGSGATDSPDRFYSLRDYAPFQRLSQSEHDARPILSDDDLATVVTGDSSSPVADPNERTPGWKLDLPSGERSLSDSITVNGVVLFTTFKPADSATDLCEATGTNRVYAIKVENGTSALDLNGDAQITDTDRSVKLDEEEKAVGTPRIELVWPEVPANQNEEPGDTGGNNPPPAPPEPTEPPASQGQPAPTTRCYAGTEVLRQCVPLDAMMRTFWKRTTVN